MKVGLYIQNARQDISRIVLFGHTNLYHWKLNGPWYRLGAVQN